MANGRYASACYKSPFFDTFGWCHDVFFHHFFGEKKCSSKNQHRGPRLFWLDGWGFAHQRNGSRRELVVHRPGNLTRQPWEFEAGAAFPITVSPRDFFAKTQGYAYSHHKLSLDQQPLQGAAMPPGKEDGRTGKWLHLVLHRLCRTWASCSLTAQLSIRTTQPGTHLMRSYSPPRKPIHATWGRLHQLRCRRPTMFFGGEASLWSYRQRQRRDLWVLPWISPWQQTSWIETVKNQFGAAMSAAVVLVHDNVW